MTPAPIRVGLIGFGFAGRTFHAPLIGAVSGLEIVAVASSDAARVYAVLPNAAVTASAETLAVDCGVDLVVIASPNATHAPLTLRALAAGKHVVVDKPFAVTLGEARAMVAAADTHGRLLAVFHNRRWDSDFLSVAAVVAAGKVGRIAHLESHFDRFRSQVRDRWRERAEPGAGIWYDLGPHLVDQALCLMGMPDGITLDRAAQREGAQADDWAHAVLHFGNARAVLHSSMLVAGGGKRFTVHGDAGSLVKANPDQQEAQLIAGMTPGAPGWGEDSDPFLLFDAEGRPSQLSALAGDQSRFYAGVRDAIRDGAPNPVPPIEALAVMAVIEAGIRSAAEGRHVEIPLTHAERDAYARSRR